ncbi:MAG: hypothetical protein M3Y87_24570, partial [Myxococcota bacterium]|nr:hypothetical protein [Myxococcota bacterium]
MRHPALFLFASLLTSLAGCYASGDRDAPAVAVEGDLACRPDELALAWVHEDVRAGTYHPVQVDIAPGGALLLTRSNFEGSATRLRDGAPIARLASAPLDAAWTRTVEIDPERRQVIVRELATGAVLRTIERLPALAELYGHTSAVLTRDGTRALVLDCDRDGDAARTM